MTSLQAENATLADPARSAVEELLVLKAQADPEGLRIEASPDPDAPLQASTFEAVQQLVGAANTAASAPPKPRPTGPTSGADSQGARRPPGCARLNGAPIWPAPWSYSRKRTSRPGRGTQRIAELVETASELLLQMTGGRYRFDNHLRISDEVAGATRSATTLLGRGKVRKPRSRSPWAWPR